MTYQEWILTRLSERFGAASRLPKSPLRRATVTARAHGEPDPGGRADGPEPGLGRLAQSVLTRYSRLLVTPEMQPQTVATIEADARTRTGDPFITSTRTVSRLHSVHLGLWLCVATGGVEATMQFRLISAACVALEWPTTRGVTQTPTH